VWEDELLGEFRNLLANVVLQPNVIDQWVWQHDPSGGYTVRGAYKLLSYRDLQGVEATTYLIWHKQVPLKATILTWRLLRNRLPTKDNLVRQHIITHESSNCVSGYGGVETSQHLFLSCPVFPSLWSMIRSCVGISSADPLLILTILFSLPIPHEVHEHAAFFLQLLWLCSIWVIWHERNNRIFKAEESTVLHLLDKVKVHSLWWMTTSNVNLGLNSHM
jgi:hypothetical protein